MRAVLAAAAVHLASAVAATAVIRGAASYDESEALPPGAALGVQLVDTTADGTPARPEAELTIPIRRRGVVPFVITYDPAAIDPDRRGDRR